MHLYINFLKGSGCSYQNLKKYYFCILPTKCREWLSFLFCLPFLMSTHFLILYFSITVSFIHDFISVKESGMGPRLHTFTVFKTQGAVSLDFTTHSFHSYSKDFILQQILFIASYRIYILRLLLLSWGIISPTWKNNITWAIKIISRCFISVDAF